MALPATDTFTTDVDAALTTYSANWTINAGGFSVKADSDVVWTNNGSSGENGAHWNVEAFNNDQYAEGVVANIDSISAGMGVAVRCAASANTYYGFYSDSNNSYLFKVVATVFTQLGSSATAYGAGATVRIEANGTTITPKVNGSTTNTPGAQTDASDNITSGYAGLSGFGTSNLCSLTSWEGGNLVTSTQVNVSDTAQGTDNAPTISASVSRTETGTGVDSSSISASLGISDSGTGAEGISKLLLTSIADSGIGVDTTELSASLGMADSALGGDFLDISASLAVSDAGSGADSVSVIIASFPETFEGDPGTWLVNQDTTGAGSAITRSNEQAYAGTYSAKCATTNSGAVAQIRYTINSPWSGVPSADPGEFIWQKAFIYIPSGTAGALTGTEYLDLAGFYVSGDATGWYLRLKAGSALYAVGPGSGGQAAFNLYKTVPLDQWIELEICLWSQNIEAGGRSFIVFINGDCYGWYRLGVISTNYDRVAMGILATNSADDLVVYIDNWYQFTSGANPSGTDNRLTSDPTTIDFTSQSGKDIDFQYQTWEEAGIAWQDATRGIGGFRSQAGPNSDKQRANLESGWAEIVLDWVGGIEPAWPPDELWGTYFFAAMVAFKKYFPDEENLEIVVLYNWLASGTAELAYESWVTGQLVYALWELPEATAQAGAHFPEPGDKIRVRWEEISATNLRVEVHYYDASTGIWYWNVIVDERDMSNSNGVNWLDNKHNSVSITTETTKYSVRSIQYGTLNTSPDYISIAELAFSSENITSSIYVLTVDVGAGTDSLLLTSTLISGSAVWGQITGVLETNVRTYADNWAGTGEISGTGDSEQICLASGQYMVSEVVQTGVNSVVLLQSEYGSGDTVLLQYRHGATEADCLSASWNTYSSAFTSLGYVQIRIESTL